MPRDAASRMNETDLYRPVHDYLVEQGYAVQGEVRKCDVAAVKGDELVIVELKLRLNAEVLAQAAMRQQITDSVYVAVPRPKSLRSWRARTKGLLYAAANGKSANRSAAARACRRPSTESGGFWSRPCNTGGSATLLSVAPWRIRNITDVLSSGCIKVARRDGLGNASITERYGKTKPVTSRRSNGAGQ